MTAHGLLPPSICRLLNASKVLCSSVLMPVLTPTCWDSADYQPAFFQIHVSLTASFETSSLRREAESSGLGSPEQGWGERRVPCNSNGLSGLPEKTASVKSVPHVVPWPLCMRLLLSVRRYTRHRDHRGRKGLAVQHGSFSRPCTPGEQESALHGTRILQSHPHLPWWVRWGTSQSPREARVASGERSGRRTIWTRRTRKAAHCEGDGPAALFLHWKPPCSQRWESPSVRRHSWKVPFVREDMRKTRAGAEASTWRPSRRGNFNRITVSPAKQRQDWSTARWGAEVITAVTAHPITSATVVPKIQGGLSICWHERSIVTVIVTPPERVCCW